jgi:hypothetical protein
MSMNEFDLIKQSFMDCLNKQQIKEFVLMIKEIENKTERVYPEIISTTFYRFIQFLLVKNLIDYSKQVILKFLIF